ncbi:MAG TPA: tetratricopeptide repeat protein [Chthonomonadaceae bacterium]|nr:tetratricopeptide repeat protein [Chthonomonadaceae bacterium]
MASTPSDFGAMTADASPKSILQTRRGVKFSWRILLFLVVLAILVDLGGMALWNGRKSAHISAVLPNVPDLHELRALVRDDPKNKDLHLLLAQSYLHYKHYLSARSEYDQALQLGADEWAVRSGRAQANRALARTDLLEQDLTRMIAMRPALMETYLTLAEERQYADDLAGAKRILDQIPRDHDGLPQGDGPDRLANAELLATAYSHLDAWDDVHKLIAQCLQIDPKRLSSHIILGKTLHATGKRADAIPYLLEGVKAAPKNAELQYLLGTAYQARKQSGDEDRAFVCLQNAVHLDERHGAATLALAEECDRRGLKEPAAFAYMQAFKLGMEGAVPMLRSGELLLQAGNKEEGWYREGVYYETIHQPELALKEYTNLTTLHSCCRSGYIHLARVYGLINNPQKELECLHKAQELDPARAKELEWSIVDALNEERDDEGCARVLKGIETRGGKEADEAAYQLAVLADHTGKTDEAIQWMRRCVASQPKDGVFHRELGRLLLEQRGDSAKLQAAIPQLETAVQLAPEDYNAFYELGRAYSYANNLDDAILALRHAVDLQPESGEGYQALGQALNRAGQKQEASDILATFQRFEDFEKTRETLEARCKRNPTDAEAQRRTAEFHMRAHEYLAAVGRYRKCLALQPENRQARARLAEALGYLGRREEQRAQLAVLNAPGGGL